LKFNLLLKLFLS